MGGQELASPHKARGWERNPMADKKAPPWIAKELSLLGTMPDPDVARQADAPAAPSDSTSSSCVSNHTRTGPPHPP